MLVGSDFIKTPVSVLGEGISITSNSWCLNDSSQYSCGTSDGKQQIYEYGQHTFCQLDSVIGDVEDIVCSISWHPNLPLFVFGYLNGGIGIWMKERGIVCRMPCTAEPKSRINVITWESQGFYFVVGDDNGRAMQYCYEPTKHTLREVRRVGRQAGILNAFFLISDIVSSPVTGSPLYHNNAVVPNFYIVTKAGTVLKISPESQQDIYSIGSTLLTSKYDTSMNTITLVCKDGNCAIVNVLEAELHPIDKEDTLKFRLALHYTASCVYVWLKPAVLLTCVDNIVKTWNLKNRNTRIISHQKEENINNITYYAPTHTLFMQTASGLHSYSQAEEQAEWEKSLSLALENVNTTDNMMLQASVSQTGTSPNVVVQQGNTAMFCSVVPLKVYHGQHAALWQTTSKTLCVATHKMIAEQLRRNSTTGTTEKVSLVKLQAPYHPVDMCIYDNIIAITDTKVITLYDLGEACDISLSNGVIPPIDVKSVLECATSNIALTSDSIYTVGSTGIECRNHGGVLKYVLPIDTCRHGNVDSMKIVQNTGKNILNGNPSTSVDTLLIATTDELRLYVFDLSRRDPKTLVQGRDILVVKDQQDNHANNANNKKKLTRKLQSTSKGVKSLLDEEEVHLQDVPTTMLVANAKQARIDGWKVKILAGGSGCDLVGIVLERPQTGTKFILYDVAVDLMIAYAMNTTVTGLVFDSLHSGSFAVYGNQQEETEEEDEDSHITIHHNKHTSVSCYYYSNQTIGKYDTVRTPNIPITSKLPYVCTTETDEDGQLALVPVTMPVLKKNTLMSDDGLVLLISIITALLTNKLYKAKELLAQARANAHEDLVWRSISRFACAAGGDIASQCLSSLKNPKIAWLCTPQAFGRTYSRDDPTAVPGLTNSMSSQALLLLSRALDISTTTTSPQDEELLVRLHTISGRHEEAISLAQQNARLLLSTVYHSIGKSSWNKGKTEDAFVFFRKAHSITTSLSKLLLLTGRPEVYLACEREGDLVWTSEYCLSKHAVNEALEAILKAVGKHSFKADNPSLHGGNALAAKASIQMTKILLRVGKVEDAEAYVTKCEGLGAKLVYARWLESQGQTAAAMKWYVLANSASNAARLAMSTKNGPALHTIGGTWSNAGFLAIARDLERRKKLSEAVQVYIRAAKQWDVVSDVPTNNNVNNNSISLFQTPDTYEQVAPVIPYLQSITTLIPPLLRALHLCLSVPLPDHLPSVLSMCENITLPAEALNNCINMIKNNDPIQAAILLATNKKFQEAIVLLTSDNITQASVDACTPNRGDVDDNTRKQLLLDLAKICEKGKQYVWACKRYTMAGDKARAVRCLCREGDIGKVCYYAKTARQKEVIVMAARWLRQMYLTYNQKHKQQAATQHNTDNGYTVQIGNHGVNVDPADDTKNSIDDNGMVEVNGKKEDVRDLILELYETARDHNGGAEWCMEALDISANNRNYKDVLKWAKEQVSQCEKGGLDKQAAQVHQENAEAMTGLMTGARKNEVNILERGRNLQKRCVDEGVRAMDVLALMAEYCSKTNRKNEGQVLIREMIQLKIDVWSVMSEDSVISLGMDEEVERAQNREMEEEVGW